MVQLPTRDLWDGIDACWEQPLWPWDLYFERMAETDLRMGKGEVIATKTWVVRTAPFGGTHILLGGLTHALRDMVNLRLDDPVFLEGLRRRGRPLLAEFCARHGHIKVQVFAPPEGTAFFPGEPIISVRGPLPFVRLLEGIFSQDMNWSSLNLTCWRRMVRAAAPQTLNDQGWRRGSNPMRASLYGYLAGTIGTSNVEMARYWDIPLFGTQGHEFAQSIGDVYEAHFAYLKHNPDQPFCLVDANHTMQIDYPAFLKAVWELRDQIMEADAPKWGPRNDSQDIAWLCVEQWKIFRQHPLYEIPWFRERFGYPIANGLNEFSIDEMKAKIWEYAAAEGLDGGEIVSRIGWGSGTHGGVCESDPALDGVMKLADIEVDGTPRPTIKLALDTAGKAGAKTSNPGFLRSARILDANGVLQRVLVFFAHLYEVRNGKICDVADGRPLETIQACHPNSPVDRTLVTNYTAVSQQELIYDSLSGDGFTHAWERPTLDSVREHIEKQDSSLPIWTRTLKNPTPIQVSLMRDVFNLRQEMISGHALQAEYPFDDHALSLI